MRGILFRGKTLDGRWIYGDLWQRPYAKNCVTIVSFMEDTGTTGGLEVIPETVGQYTGVDDKNGVKIFEGDIVACGDGKVPTEIRWVQESSAFMAYNLKRKEYHLLNKYFDRFIGEIIGNIHDNPGPGEELFD